MRKNFYLFIGLCALVGSGCGSNQDEDPSDTGPVGQNGGSLSTALHVCDLRYKSRYTARNFGSDVATPSLLSVIGWAEGLGNCYHYSFTYKTFPSFAAHPATSYCANGLCSTAAGRYQFIKATWNHVAIKKGLSSFEPRYQDEGALALIDEKQVDDYKEVYDFPRFKRAITLLAPVWASLPGGPYDQPNRTIEESWQRYQQFLKSE